MQQVSFRSLFTDSSHMVYLPNITFYVTSHNLNVSSKKNYSKNIAKCIKISFHSNEISTSAMITDYQIVNKDGWMQQVEFQSNPFIEKTNHTNGKKYHNFVQRFGI